jgi:hypothetical protein
MTDDTLEIIFALIKQLESTMLGLRQLRELVAKGVAQHITLLRNGSNPALPNETESVRLTVQPWCTKTRGEGSKSGG